MYNLFEEEREKLERGFEELSQELLNRLNDTDSEINYVKDMLSSDKKSVTLSLGNAKKRDNYIIANRLINSIFFILYCYFCYSNSTCK